MFGCLEKYLFTLFCFELRKAQKSHCGLTRKWLPPKIAIFWPIGLKFWQGITFHKYIFFQFFESISKVRQTVRKSALLLNGNLDSIHGKHIGSNIMMMKWNGFIIILASILALMFLRRNEIWSLIFYLYCRFCILLLHKIILNNIWRCLDSKQRGNILTGMHRE